MTLVRACVDALGTTVAYWRTTPSISRACQVAETELAVLPTSRTVGTVRICIRVPYLAGFPASHSAGDLSFGTSGDGDEKAVSATNC